MARYLCAAAIGFLLGAGAVRAQEYYDLRVAQEHLQAAWDSLKAAPADERGHRDRALAHVNSALEEIHLALTGNAPRGRWEKKSERREDALEQKNERRERRLKEKAEKREERMEER